MGFLLWRLLRAQALGARSVVVAHGLTCSEGCWILPDQGSGPCALHSQVASYPLHHQESLLVRFGAKEIWANIRRGKVRNCFSYGSFFFFSFIYKCEKALFSTKKNSQPRWQGTADNGSDTRGMAFEQSVVWVIMWRMPPPRSMVVLIIDAFLKSRICSLFFGESTIPRNYSSLSRRVPQTQMLGREYLKPRRLGMYSWPSEEQSNPVCSSSPLIKNQSRPILSLNYIFLENLDPRDWSIQWILFSK